MTVVWHEHPAAAASSRPPVRGIALGFIVALLFLVLAGGFVAFSWGAWRSSSVGARLGSVPVPVARLGTEVAWYRDVDLLARGMAAEEGKDFPDGEDYGDALALSVRRLFVERLAGQLDVVVTDIEVEAELVEDDEMLAFLSEAGWSLADYKRLILQPFVLAQKTEVTLYGRSEYQGGAREDLQAIMDKLELGIAFEDLAAQYSEDESALAKGSLGYVLPEEVDPAFSSAFALEIGETTGMIETSDAFWILRVEAVVSEEEGGNRYFLRGIAVKKRSLSDVIEEIMDDERAATFVF